MAGKVRKGASSGGGVRLVPGLDVRAGQTIAGKYRVEELIGSGASGVVISAHNIHVRERVSLKILSSYTDGQEELVQRRLEKARLAARLKSSHVARIVDIGVTDDGMPYVASECLAGTTLAAELATRGSFEVDEAARWMLEACEGLAEAHARGLIHGDLKPQNIFLAEPSARSKADAGEGDARVLKILDFGTTSPLDAIGDQSASAFFGSPAFLAPEQIQDPAKVDARADVWALGVLLYNLVSGSLPFTADSLSGVIVAVVYDAPPLLTNAPYDLARLVHRCLEKDPANRPQTVSELAAAIAPFAGEHGVRLSDRVQAMLDAEPASKRAAAGNRSRASVVSRVAKALGPSSLPPVSRSLAPYDDEDGSEPLPLVTRREKETRTAKVDDVEPLLLKPSLEVPADEPTRPSKRVVARRRSRVRSAAFGLLGAAAVLALAGWGGSHSSLGALLSNVANGVAGSSLQSSDPSAPPEQVVVPPYLPTITPIAEARATELPDALPPVSFAATSPEGITPTPLAVAHTPIASAEPLPPPVVAAPFLPPAAPLATARSATTTTPAALPSAPRTPPAKPDAAPNALPTPKSAAPAPQMAAVTPRTHALPPNVVGAARSATGAGPNSTARSGLDKPTRGAKSNLPPGLPTSREALPPYGVPSAAPPRPKASASNGRADDTYLRKLLTDRK